MGKSTLALKFATGQAAAGVQAIGVEGRRVPLGPRSAFVAKPESHLVNRTEGEQEIPWHHEGHDNSIIIYTFFNINGRYPVGVL